MLRRALRPAAIACSGFYVTRNDGPRDDDARVKQLLKQTDKARQHAQERVPHAGTFMMGVVPKQWLEVLDEKHRYGSILYPYWQRWETSRTRMSFFMWLDEGRGCLVDLPDCPRRFLEECEVLYLTRDELRLFEVEIRDGLLVWLADGFPVDLHDGAAAAAPTLRAAAAAALVDAQLVRSARRERLVDAAREAAAAAAAAGVEAVSREDRERVLAPLVAEGCLRKLRDPYHALRSQAKPSDDELHEYDRLWDAFKVRDAAEARYGLPSELPEATWGAVARALDHDDGRAGSPGRKRPLPRPLWPHVRRAEGQRRVPPQLPHPGPLLPLRRVRRGPGRRRHEAEPPQRPLHPDAGRVRRAPRGLAAPRPRPRGDGDRRVTERE